MDLQRNALICFAFLLLWHSSTTRSVFAYMTRRRLRRRRWWVRPVNRIRNAQGFYSNLVGELMATDHEEFFALFRMWPEHFNILVNLVKPFLRKTSIRTPLPTELRVAVTLMYLAQADSITSKHVEFRIGKSTVHKIIPETCRAIWLALQPIFLKQMNTDDWKNVSRSFMEKWQFPNCVGATDGKHMRIQAPPRSGSQFYNYKGFFSMVLMATCDAEYKFTFVDIGQYGSISDGGVWSNTAFAADLQEGLVGLPDPTPLPGTDIPFPHVFVGDEAFPLSTYMMRPFPRRGGLTDDQRVFNYRLSRARRTIENAFGIMTARWRILHRPLSMSSQNCESVFKAIVVLHNFVMSGESDWNVNDKVYCARDYIDCELPDGTVRPGRWRLDQSPHFRDLGRVGANYAGAIPRGMRIYLKNYLVSDIGNEQAPWQYEVALRGQRINPPR